MTVGIVAMNSAAVALASDSAMTITHSKGIKHYAGATKILGLHNGAPVAVFWYGASEYLGVPWEVIVKAFRAEHQARFPTVQEYSEAFFGYVSNTMANWPAGVTEAPGGVRILGNLLDDIDRTVNRHPADEAAAVSAAIERWKEKRRPTVEVLTAAQLDETPQLLAAAVSGLEDLVAAPSNEIRELVRGAARFAWRRLSPKEPGRTGLVFVGFGDAEPLPALCHYMVGTPTPHYPRRKMAAVERVSSGNRGVVVPFGQNDQVRLFMEGLHPDIRAFIDTSLDGLKDKGVDGLDLLSKEFDSYIVTQARPVIEAVSFLPKADLAEFARMLVLLTAFRVRHSMSDESVSEPIDVAVISRAEGLVWVHRHHYFPPALNPHFAARYQGPA